MKAETWFSCNKAIEYGFVDKEMFVDSISQSMVASIVQHLPERYQYDFMENVIKKNHHLIKRDEEQKPKVTNLQYGQKLMLLDPTGRTVKKKSEKSSTAQMVNIAKNAERVAEAYLLSAKKKIIRTVNEAISQSILEEQNNSYFEKEISNGYSHGDYIYKDGQTIPVARNQEHYQDMAERVKGI